jgi:hypothetical protein
MNLGSGFVFFSPESVPHSLSGALGRGRARISVCVSGELALPCTKKNY